MKKNDRLQRNYRIVGLTRRNTVVIEVDGEVRDSGEKPSEWFCDWLPARELTILRRGLTRAKNDRTRPRGATIEAKERST